MPISFLVIDGFNMIRRIYEARIHKENHQDKSSHVSKEDAKPVSYTHLTLPTKA